MSTSPMGNAGEPRKLEILSLLEAVANFQSSMYCIFDCLARAQDQTRFDDVSHLNFDYADRQLMLLAQYAEKARVALEFAKREVVALPDGIEWPVKQTSLFDAEKTGPYTEGR